MKLNKIIAGCAAASTLCFAQVGFAYTAVTDASPEANAKGPGNTDLTTAQIGDTFTVSQGSFHSYLPGLGDPTIATANPDGTGGDLHNYRFSMFGTVTSVTGAVVGYSGIYQIFYDLNGDGTFNGSDINVSSGTLGLSVDFNGTSPYNADGTLHQTLGSGNPAITSIPEPDATFVGIYTQTSVAGGTVQGTIESVPAPDTSATFGLLGLSALGLLALKRREVRA